MNACSPDQPPPPSWSVTLHLLLLFVRVQRLIFLITWLGFTLATASLHLFSSPKRRLYTMSADLIPSRHAIRRWLLYPVPPPPPTHYNDPATPLLISIASFLARSRFKESSFVIATSTYHIDA